MKTVMSFKIDKDVRDKARKAAKRIGLPLSTVVNQNLKQFAASPTITFGEGIPRPKVVTEVLKDLADMKKGKNISPTFDDIEAALRWLKT